MKAKKMISERKKLKNGDKEDDRTKKKNEDEELF